MNKRLIICIVAYFSFFGCAHASPFSDDFSGATINPGWTVVDTNRSSSVSLTGNGELQLVASPANGGSDLYSGSNYNAPHILQSIDPSLNWTVETELNYSPTRNYEGAGIMLANTTGPLTSTSQFLRVEERAFYPAGGGSIIEGGGGNNGYSAGSIFMKVTKVGDRYADYYSKDGVDWVLLASWIYNGTPFDEIGLYDIRQGWDGSGATSVADFDFFDIAVNNVPEPGALSLLGLGLLGLGWVSRRRRVAGQVPSA